MIGIAIPLELPTQLAASTSSQPEVAPLLAASLVHSAKFRLRALSPTILPYIIIALLVGGVLYATLKDIRRKATMPPGPQPVPFVGNKWDLPPQKPWYKFKQWTDMYGSLVTVWTGRRATVIIGDPQVAHDLLDKRHKIYSSRPRFVVMGELFTGNNSLLTMPHGGKFLKTRKIFALGLLNKVCDTYRDIQKAEAARLAHDFMTKPEGFATNLERFAASIMVCIAYGRRVDDMNDPLVRQIHDRMQYMATLNVPGAFWAESFPLLKYVPDFLAPWKREVKQRAEESSQLLLRLARQVKARMDQGEAPASFAKTLWEKHQKNPEELSEMEIAHATGSLFGAGSDTSSSTLQSFMLAMTCFPRVAAKAQEELDAVVGRDRAPTWEDQPNLPYCNAIVKETLRWRPVAVLGGTPHASIANDTYNGCFIPKGTTVLGNLWAIHHNEKYFKNSHEFMPERYLDKEMMEGVLPYPHADGHSAFGWGRRICPGKRLAENSLFIAITRILWGFNISKAQDPETKEEITPSIFAYTDGFNSKPHPFPCVITPRSEQHYDAIIRDASQANEFLDRYSSY